MTEGSLWNKILGFAFPLALTGILQQLFTAADVAVVGNFTGDLGQAAMAAVGNIFSSSVTDPEQIPAWHPYR